MNKLGLIVMVNKFKNYFSNTHSQIVCDTLEEAKKELITYLVAHFTPLKIDFPDNLEEFHNIWFNSTYIVADVFNYKIFHNDNWIEPWSQDEIYEDVLDCMHKYEIENAPDFSKIYNEPAYEDSETAQPEKEAESEDLSQSKFFSKDTDVQTIETAIQNIIMNAKESEIHNNCNCSNCELADKNKKHVSFSDDIEV